ncbi:MAG: hypothetical protein OXG52_11455 [bacterium]|nr:hypothetical protein [bacterium]
MASLRNPQACEPPAETAANAYATGSTGSPNPVGGGGTSSGATNSGGAEAVAGSVIGGAGWVADRPGEPASLHAAASTAKPTATRNQRVPPERAVNKQRAVRRYGLSASQPWDFSNTITFHRRR